MTSLQWTRVLPPMCPLFRGFTAVLMIESVDTISRDTPIHAIIIPSEARSIPGCVTGQNLPHGNFLRGRYPNDKLSPQSGYPRKISPPLVKILPPEPGLKEYDAYTTQNFHMHVVNT